jgi:hypothetical protein
VWEPACGLGHMSEILWEYFHNVLATDVINYGVNTEGRACNFLTESDQETDFVITNPPYIHAEKFCLRAIELARVGVAMFVRCQMLESIGRYERLFKPHPPTLIGFFSERVPLCKGKWDPDGGTATAYCWIVWMRGREPMPPFWIPPGQRMALTKPDDRARFAAWSMPTEAAE